jgi:hypothetical protein
VYVGIPVVGPPLYTSRRTSGTSTPPVRLIASPIRSIQGPELPTIEGAEAYEAPIAIIIAAISSSACTTEIPSRFEFLARKSFCNKIQNEEF